MSLVSPVAPLADRAQMVSLMLAPAVNQAP